MKNRKIFLMLLLILTLVILPQHAAQTELLTYPTPIITVRQMDMTEPAQEPVLEQEQEPEQTELALEPVQEPAWEPALTV